MKTLQIIILSIGLMCISYSSILINRDVVKLNERIKKLENLQLQKDIEEYSWRKELINDIKK